MSLYQLLRTNSQGEIIEISHELHTMSVYQLLRTNSISHELQELFQSLPKASAWGDELYQYQGFWHHCSSLKAVFFSHKHFQASETDVFLVTAPKSGTTWLKSLAFAITQRAQYPPSDPNHPLLASNSHRLLPAFEIVYNHEDNPDLSHIPSPRLFGAHYAYKILPDSVKNANCRILYLCRNPKDTFVSMWHYLNQLVKCPIPLEEAFELFCKGINTYGPVWDHMLGYWNQSIKAPQSVLFLKYEDLKGDTVSQVKKMAEFLGFPFSSKEVEECVAEEIVKLCSFENLSNLPVNKKAKNSGFFRKGKVGDWANYLTPSMAKQLDTLTEEKLLGSGLSFSY